MAGKFIFALITVFLIEFVLYYFGGSTYATTSLFQLIQNPSSFLSSALYAAIIIALGIFAAAIIVAGLFVNINIYSMYAGLALAVITFGMSIAHLFSFIVGSLNPSILATPIAMIVTGPILILYFIACLEWVRDNN